ncbi:hypothetical protein ACIRG5_26235 [Lentzea sp. NPDC102401]|uniref:hypothetical protein n=1 Tax=Lentzea sp. NPDC102401 TaxID=3364128 RepID=UPI003815A7FE
MDRGEITLDSLKSTDDEDRVINAEIIHGLLAGTYGNDLHPHGIRIRYARIAGSLNNVGEPHPSFEFNSRTFPVGIKFEHCWLDHPMLAHDARVPWLHLDNCVIPYFHADRVRVDGSLYLRGLKAGGGTDLGAVRLLGAHIGRNLELDRAVLHNKQGPSLHAEGIQVDRALRFRAASLESTCDTGAVQLVNAHVRGDFWLDGTHIHNEKGPALNAEGLEVGGSLLLCSGFVATARSKELATVHLMCVRVGSRLDFGEGRDATGHLWDTPRGEERELLPKKAAVIKNDEENEYKNHLTVDLGCASTDDLRLPAETVCTHKRPRWHIRKKCSNNKIIVVGLKYAMLSRESAHRHWSHWLRDHADRFEAQPYQHLAKTLRDNGHTTEARRLLIRLENARRKHGKAHWWSSWSSWPWHLAKRAFIGHGYRPGRALIGLLVVLATATFVMWQAQSAGSIQKPGLLHL